MRKNNQIFLLNLRKVAAIFFLFVIILSGCRSTKYVPEGEYLLNKVTIESDNKEVKPKDIKPFVKQKPNAKLLGITKLRLWIYNRSPKNKNGWLARTLKKVGEEPVIYEGNRTVQSEKEIKRHLANKGFTNAEVESSVKINDKKRKTNVTYHLNCNTPYRIAKTQTEIKDSTIANIVLQDSSKSLIHEGMLFDLDILDAERERLTASLKNKGYYDFSKENFSFHVDTTIGQHQIADVLVLNNDTSKASSIYHQYRIRNIRFIVGYDAQKALKDNEAYFKSMDSVIYRDLLFLSEGPSKVKPEIIYRNNLLKPGMLYSKSLSDRTHSLLSAIAIIRYVNINYQELDNHELDCSIYISLAKPQTFKTEVEGTYLSGNIGGEVSINHKHKNLFGGAELLSTSLSLGSEAIIPTDDDNVYYSKELGANIELTYPKFVFPFLKEDFKQKSRAETSFGLSFDYQKRPEYTRHIATADMMYSWRHNDHIRHQLTPLMLNYISLPEMTDDFAAHIETTEYLKYSYQDHVIFGSRYAITLQNGNDGPNNTSRYLRLSLESSGNMLNNINRIIGAEKVYIYDSDGVEEESYYNFMNVRYSQYIRFDANGVISHHINENNTLAYRAQFGIGIPYMNSSQLPFERRYFGGGANGVRAWMVRSLGPGTYYNDDVDYYNQSGDISFVASMEYRFNLFWILEGAVFVDVGNTWTIRDYEEQPGAVFKFDSFYNELAAGIGTGARLDLSFFVFRLDVAWKAIDPTETLGERWVLGNDLKPTTHIAIGYPF